MIKKAARWALGVDEEGEGPIVGGSIAVPVIEGGGRNMRMIWARQSTIWVMATAKVGTFLYLRYL
jgi:hypothetical protein